MSKYVTCDVEGNVAVVSISNPPVNTLTAEVAQELSQRFDELKSNDQVRAVILTGQGKSFVAGANIKFLLTLNRKTGEEYALTIDYMQRKIEEFEWPVIAAINGHALGGGCELAMSCDIRIASKKALFGQPEVTLGVIPGAGGTQRLIRLVPMGRAKRLLFSGEHINADEAERIGLIDQVTPPGEELAEAKKLAQKIVKNAPIALRSIKKAVRRGAEMSLNDALRMEAAIFGEVCDTEDVKEGVSAFFDKRAPNFLGK